MTVSPLADVAQQHLARGLAVVALFERQKHPSGPWGEYQRRLPNPDELSMMFSANGHGPPTGLAVVIDEATWNAHPGLFVLDVEARHRALAEPWLDQHIPGWRDGLVAESGSVGLHLYLRAPSPVRTRRFAWGDLLGQGSICVLPPSLHPSGGRYRWLSQGEPIRVDPATLPLPGLSSDRPAYADLAEGPILEQHRNLTLVSLAGLLRRSGLDVATIETTLHAINSERCEPPLDDAEVRTIARSVGRYEPGAENLPRNLTSHLRPPPLEVRFLTKRPAVEVAAACTGTDLPSLPLIGQAGYIIRDWGHMLAGYPKSGKTELLAYCVRGWLAEAITVHWLTEESEGIWSQRLARWGSVPDGLFLTFALGSDQDVLLHHALSSPEDILIVDTVRNLFGYQDENDNSLIARALIPWEAALRGRTRIYVHHGRKGGGDHGEGIAGAAAFLGVVDRALELKHDGQNKRRRLIDVYSRIVEAPSLLYTMDDDHQLVALGDPCQVALATVQERAMEVLSDEWVKTRDLLDALDEPRPSLEQLRQGLTALAHDGRAERVPPVRDQATGRTVRWRLVGGAMNLTSNGQAL